MIQVKIDPFTMNVSKSCIIQSASPRKKSLTAELRGTESVYGNWALHATVLNNVEHGETFINHL